MRIISPNTFRVYAFILEHLRDTCDTPTFEATRFYFRGKPTTVAVALAILERHHFIRRENQYKFEMVQRKPLLMPFRGVVK